MKARRLQRTIRFTQIKQKKGMLQEKRQWEGAGRTGEESDTSRVWV
jgi:hypothetical protein